MDKITNAFTLYPSIVKVQKRYYKFSEIFLLGNIGPAIWPEILIQEPLIQNSGRGTHGHYNYAFSCSEIYILIYRRCILNVPYICPIYDHSLVHVSGP